MAPVIDTRKNARKRGPKKGGSSRESKRAVAYLRVSTDEQQKSGYGLPAQRTAIEDYAKDKGYTVVEYVQDGGVSGNMQPEKRPGWQRVIALVEQGDIGAVLVFKFDRVSRQFRHSIATVLGFHEDRGVPIKSATEPDMDVETSMGKAMLGMMASYAESEARKITERTLRGKMAKAMATGRSVCSKIPYGYRRGADGEIQIVEDQAEIVRLIFDKYWTGRRQDGTPKRGKRPWGMREIARDLTARKVPTPGGTSSPWSAVAVRRILLNPNYCGFIHYRFDWGKNSERVEGEVKRKGEFPPIVKARIK